MPINDLFHALKMFQSGVQDLAQQRAIQQANDTVQQIRSSEANEADKRAQLQQISNDLVARLAQSGTPATTIQAVAGAVGPAPLQTPGQAVEQAYTTPVAATQEFYKQAASDLTKAKQGPADKIQMEMLKFEHQKQLQQQRLDQKSQQFEVNQKREAMKLPSKDREAITSSFTVMDAAKNINDKLSKIPANVRLNPQARRYDPNVNELYGAVELFKKEVANAYEGGRLSDQDREYYDRVFGRLDDFKTPEAFLAAIESVNTRAKSNLENRFKTLEGEGKSVKAHRERLNLYTPGGEAAAASEPKKPSGPRIEKRFKKSTGQMVSVEVDDNGKVIREVQ